MQLYEYKVVPAPQRGEKAKGARTSAERFAAALMNVMNGLGRDGWDYVRADTLPCEERVGLTGKASSFQHMLVFRRPLPQAAAEPPQSPALPAPAATPAPVLTLHTDRTAPRVTPFAKPVVVPVPDLGGAAGPMAGAPVGPARGNVPGSD